MQKVNAILIQVLKVTISVFTIGSSQGKKVKYKILYGSVNGKVISLGLGT